MAPHFYASDEFLQVVADVYFPGARPENVQCSGFHTRTLVRRGTAVTGFYNRALATYSPGAILRARLLRHRFESGDSEFDFLVGREPHKFHHATHVRLLDDIGHEPRLSSLRREARRQVGRRLAAHPAAQKVLRATESAATGVVAKVRPR